MASINRHLLSRNIPADIKRQVRQRDQFGCVVCGSAFYTYEHFDPEFANAERHDAIGICLLCSQCQGRKTKGMLSVETVRQAVKYPRCRRLGFSWGAFDVGVEHPLIILGTFTAYKAKTLIQIDAEKVFSILPPEELGGPFRINARFFDSFGNLVLEIHENEWRSSSDNWDVELVGRRLMIRRGRGDMALCLRSEPPAKLIVEQLDMQYRDVVIQAREGHQIRVKAGGNEFLGTEYQGNECEIGILVDRAGHLSVGLGCKGGVLLSGVVSARPFSPMRPRRNSLCWCGSGKRLKHCHGKV